MSASAPAKYPFKFKLKEISDDPTVQKFLSRRTLNRATRQFYVKAIRTFCEYYKKPPREVISSFKPLSPDEIVNEFADWFVSVKNRLASKSVWAWLPGIKGWLVENGIREVDRVGRDIAREFRRKFGRVKTLLKRDIISKQEIRKVLKVSSKRERAIIMLMASSGLRVSATLNVQIKHFKDDIWNPDLACYALEIPEQLSKDGEPYLTFTTSETVESIREILLERTEKNGKTDGETFLFVTKRGNTPLSIKRFSNLWRRKCKEANLDMRAVPIKGYHPVGKKGGGIKLENNGVRYNIRIHSLRKFFKTSCSVAGVDHMASETFMGHSLAQFGVESIYDFAFGKKEWLREEYLKVLPNFAFLKPLTGLPLKNGEARKRIKELESKIEELEEKNQEFNDLKDRLSRIESSRDELSVLLKRVEGLEKKLKEKKE